MTKLQAIKLINDYADFAANYQGYVPELNILVSMGERWPKDGSVRKAMRWLGFCQGVLHAAGIFTLEDLKKHSKERKVTP